jgi:hypothetical protein
MGDFIVITLIVGAFLLFSKRILRVSDDDTFDAYQIRNPDLVKNGRVTCAKCGGTSIWMKQVAYSPFGVKYAHTCRNCGNQLYHSRS